MAEHKSVNVVKVALDNYRYVEAVMGSDKGFIHVHVEDKATEYDADAIVGLLVRMGWKPEVCDEKKSGYHFTFSPYEDDRPIGSFKWE